jgi:hypothetical protein
MSASDSCVCRRMFKSRIVARMVFSAEELTAGLKPQNIESETYSNGAGSRIRGSRTCRSDIVTSRAAPVASGRSGSRAGLTPAGKRRLVTAHTQARRLTRR